MQWRRCSPVRVALQFREVRPKAELAAADRLIILRTGFFLPLGSWEKLPGRTFSATSRVSAEAVQECRLPLSFSRKNEGEKSLLFFSCAEAPSGTVVVVALCLSCHSKLLSFHPHLRRPSSLTSHRMAKDLEVNVEGHPSVIVEVVPEEFSLAQFDAWVRSRFGLKHDIPLAYLNDAGKDIVVDKVYVKLNDSVKIVIKAPPKPAQPPQDFTFSYTFLALTTLLLLLAVYGEGPVKQIFNVEAHCRTLDDVLLASGIISKPGVSMDAFVAIVCWGATYLYIRRLWNPETMDATFQRFSADSFFGGLAAGASVILKAFLVKVLIEKK